MRTVTYGVASSLDGFIAREDGGVDWLFWSDDVAALSAEYWKTIDTVVMGRRSYEAALRMGTTSYPGVRNVVFSRTMRESPDPAVEIVAEDAAAWVREHKAGEGAGICVLGGGELARALFEADAIDEVGLNVHPVLLGSGIPAFHPMTQQTELELLQCRTLQHGCVYVLYRVRR